MGSGESYWIGLGTFLPDDDSGWVWLDLSRDGGKCSVEFRKQGSVLGTVLFVCYINDLPEETASFIFMYADDTEIFRRVSDDMDRPALQRDLDVLSEWATWQLHFDISNCKVTHLGAKNSVQGYTTIDGNELRINLETTEEEKDLGVWFDNNLKPSNHVAHAVRKANKLLGLIRRSLVYMDSDGKPRDSASSCRGLEAVFFCTASSRLDASVLASASTKVPRSCWPRQFEAVPLLCRLF